MFRYLQKKYEIFSVFSLDIEGDFFYIWKKKSLNLLSK